MHTVGVAATTVLLGIDVAVRVAVRVAVEVAGTEVFVEVGGTKVPVGVLVDVEVRV